MKKNLFLRLCLIMIALLSFHSCRQDLLPDKETYHNSSAFQLTSKRISLGESKHKTTLIPQLEKSKEEIKKIKTDIHGKAVTYGNGVSIDTDDVIYIENGPDYHTYTFAITRQGAPADAPLENLILTPLSDGTYRELIYSYDLTELEKQNMAQGLYVDVKNKVTVTELSQGTYNSNGQIMKINCQWSSSTIWETCGAGVHGSWNIEEWHLCKDPVPPRAYAVMTFGCGNDGGGDGGGSNTPSTGDGGSNGGGDGEDDGEDGEEPPCNENGVLTGPQTPGFYDLDGCSGIPSQPNSPLLTPCKRAARAAKAAKNIMNDTHISSKVESLQPSVATDSLEKGFNFGIGMSAGYSVSGTYTGTATGLSNMPNTETGFTVHGSFHTHPTLKAYECFSPADFYKFNENNQSNANFSTMFTLGASGGVYNVAITDPVKFNNFTNNYAKGIYLDVEGHWKEKSIVRIDSDKVEREFIKQGQTEDEAFALAQAFVLKKYDLGISISKKDSNGDFKPIFVNEVKDPLDPTKVNYEQTETCNL